MRLAGEGLSGARNGGEGGRVGTLRDYLRDYLAHTSLPTELSPGTLCLQGKVPAGGALIDPDLGHGDYNQPTSVRVRMDTDLIVITDILSNCEDHQLLWWTIFHKERLEEAIEEGVERVSFMLMDKDHFTGPENRCVTELAEMGNRAGAFKLLLDLVMEKGSGARRVLWESFVELHHHLPKLSTIFNEIQERGDIQCAYMEIDRSSSERAMELQDVRRKHRETLQAQTENLMRKVFQLDHRYVELTVISTVRDRRLVEHELLAGGRDHKSGEKFQTDQLLKMSFAQKYKGPCSGKKSGTSAAVAGVSGIGKTTMVQMIVYDWATNQINKQFDFVFSFKFRDLNTINDRINLKELILVQYPYFWNILREVWENPEKLLFIFDGLDEFNYKINFDDSWRDTEPLYTCTDPEFPCRVSDIVYSLIQHKLLPGCSVLVTTRPSALHLLQKADISVRFEVLGFIGEERKQYFIDQFEDQTSAETVFKDVEKNEILYTMSCNPSYCSILAQALGPLVTQNDRDTQQIPKTITELYCKYIYNILKEHGREIENPRDLLLRIGQMAFRGLFEKMIVFTNGYLIKSNIHSSQFQSVFLKLLLEGDYSARSLVYTFPNLTVQEFVAALAQFLKPHPGDILKFLTGAHSATDGRFEMFLRFVAGLPSAVKTQGLEELLGAFPDETTCRVIDWVKKEFKCQSGNTWNEAGKRSFLNTLHYLFESQDRRLAQEALGSVKTLSFSGMTLTPIDCTVLSHVIGLCDTIKHLNLRGCCIQYEGIQRLGPELHKCQELSLAENELGDSGVKQVSVALNNPECRIEKLGLREVGLTVAGAKDLALALCASPSLTELDLSANKLEGAGVKEVSGALSNQQCRIQKLWLSEVGLTNACADDIASDLSQNCSLTELDLGANKLGDSVVKRVSTALVDSRCKLQKLWLYDVCLTGNGAKDLISTLSRKRSLTELSLNDNKLGDSGVKLVFAALRNPECKIQNLWLWNVGQTDSSADDVALVLKTNRSLTELNLNGDKLGDSGVKLVSAAFRKAECKIRKLCLRDVGLTDSGAQDLASVLSKNRSLTELNLSSNRLGDSGVKLVSAALRNPECKIKKLWLSDIGLTDSCAEDLASALSTKPSLTELNLGGNKLGDSGVKLMSTALRNPECKIQKLWLHDVGLTANGAKDFISILSINRSLTELCLNDNKLGDSGVKMVSAALRVSECEMQKLWLRDVGVTDSGAADLASVLSTSRSLTELNLGANKLGDSGVKLLSAALRNSECKIQKLWLYDVGLTANGAKDLISVLSTSRSLTELSLNDNKLGDSGVKLVSTALRNSECRIQKLWLMDVGLTDSGAEGLVSTLVRSPSLNTLILNNNKLGDTGVKLLSAALMKSRCKLQKLGLWNVGLTDSGTGDLALALSTIPSLTELNLNDNKLGDSGVKLLSDYLRKAECKIQKLWLRDIGLTDAGAEYLGSALSINRSLMELNLGANKLGDSGVKLVATALRDSGCKIQKLWLWNIGLTDSGAEVLASALSAKRSLTELDLNDNKLGDSGVKLLSAALKRAGCELQKIWLRDVGLTDAAAKALASALSTHPSVVELNLGANKLGDSGFKKVSAALRESGSKIQKLWLYDVGLTDSGTGDLALALSTNPSLTELNLNDNKLGDSGVKLLSDYLRKTECKIQKLSLRDIGLSDAGAEYLGSALSTNRSLMELNLGANKLGDSGVKLVSAALRESGCKIQKLLLYDVGLTDSGTADLALALSTKPSLTELNLNDNKIGDSGVKLLSAALRESGCKIQKLWLRDVGLTDSSAEDLASALSTNPSLTELNLGANQLRDSGVKLVAAALRYLGCKIQKLCLDNVGLTDAGAEHLSSDLSTNKSLKELSLSVNTLGDSGVKLMSASLKKPECKIQKLELIEVGLTDSGAEDLVSALNKNPSLTDLKLGSNLLTDRSVPALRRLILTLPFLEWIVLVRNRFSETGMKELESLQEHRPGLRVIL